jgi:hypothetical protein
MVSLTLRKLTKAHGVVSLGASRGSPEMPQGCNMCETLLAALRHGITALIIVIRVETFAPSQRYMMRNALQNRISCHLRRSPAQRWRELRFVAEALRSDIFQFRTRTSPYTQDLSEPRNPELELIGRVQNARVLVVQLGGLIESSFTRSYPAKVYTHGENAEVSSESLDLSKLGADAPIDIKDGKNNPKDKHHSPMKPVRYTGSPLIPTCTLNYYQGCVSK